MSSTGNDKLENTTLPLVSVCITTYQHKDFIKQCLEGVLNQKTNFPFEIILGEDESTDGTREICVDYANKFPKIIRLFLRSRKDVIFVNGKPTSRFNLLENFKAASGKYIAWCDGDDFWTDENKLQMQVEFLENNPDFTLCFTNIRHIDKSGKIIRDSILNYQTDVFTQESFVVRITPPTMTTVFRKNALPVNELPEGFYKILNADMFIKAIISSHGKVKYINKITGSKCQHEGGIYSTKSYFYRENNRLLTFITMMKYFKSEKVRKNLRNGIGIIYARLLFYSFIRFKLKKFVITLFAASRFWFQNYLLARF
ncbi:MAG TPA: glycosyltransferase [Bacteroidia bacterium]|nr:glycosyltransferase [Bacteroidia bacterium]